MTHNEEQYEKIRQMVEKAAIRDKKHNRLVGTLDMMCVLAVPLIIIDCIVLYIFMDTLNDIVCIVLMSLAVNLIFIPSFVKDSIEYSYLKKHGMKTTAMVTNAHKQLRVFMYDAVITISANRSFTATHREYRPWLKPKNGDIIEILYPIDNPNGFIWIKEFRLKRRCNIAMSALLNFIFLILLLVALR